MGSSYLAILFKISINLHVSAPVDGSEIRRSPVDMVLNISLFTGFPNVSYMLGG